MRIVSLLASGTEIVCALGAGDALVGRSHECDKPEWVRRLPACTRPVFDVSSRAIDTEVRRRLKEGARWRAATGAIPKGVLNSICRSAILPVPHNGK
jgi:hypothetical protein